MLAQLALAALAALPALHFAGVRAAPETATVEDFVRTDGAKFRLGNSSFYFAGTNAYWWSFTPDINDVSLAMDQARAAGLKVIRTWAFRDLNVIPLPGGLPQYGNERAEPSTIYYQSWENGTPTINYGDNGLKRLDQVVELAEKKGLKLIMTLTNNWADYGGMDVYTVNVGGKYHDNFYTDTKIKSYFKAYIKAVVTRYLNSPAIFSWQLGNEPRCGADATRNLPRSSGCNPAVITAWADEISRYIKSLDPFHLVSVGDEGWFNIAGNIDWAYNGANGVDSEALAKLPAIDFGTFHAYPDWWYKTIGWTTQWVKDHAAAQARIGKPFVLEEYGWMTPEARWRNLGLISLYTRSKAMAPWQEASISTKLAGDMFWQLGVDGLSFGKSTDDGFTIFLQDAEAKTLVTDHVAKVEALNREP